MKRTLVRVLVTLAVLVASAVVADAPAHAASCYASTCTGKDPVQYGCSATTIWTVGTPGTEGYMELRKSTNCWAAWVRYTGSSGTWTGGIAGYKTNCSGCLPDDTELAPFGDYNNVSTRWSDMVNFEDWVQACYYHQWGNQVIQEGVCSPRF